MTTIDTTIHALEQRLFLVERANRRLWTALIGAAGGLLALAVIGQGSPPPQELLVKRIAVVDAHGRQRMLLGSLDDGAVGLEARDSNGHVRAVLAIDPAGGPRLMLADQDQKNRVQATVADGRPRLEALHARGGAAVLGLHGDALQPGVMLLDDAGGLRAWLRLTQGMPSLAFSDAAGKVRARLGVYEPAGPALEMWDNGDPMRKRLELLVHPQATENLILRDATGQVVLVAP